MAKIETNRPPGHIKCGDISKIETNRPPRPPPRVTGSKRARGERQRQQAHHSLTAAQCHPVTSARHLRRAGSVRNKSTAPVRSQRRPASDRAASSADKLSGYHTPARNCGGGVAFKKSPLRSGCGLREYICPRRRAKFWRASQVEGFDFLF
jgi:hypothetical protein